MRGSHWSSELSVVSLSLHRLFPLDGPGNRVKLTVHPQILDPAELQHIMSENSIILQDILIDIEFSRQAGRGLS